MVETRDQHYLVMVMFAKERTWGSILKATPTSRPKLSDKTLHIPMTRITPVPFSSRFLNPILPKTPANTCLHCVSRRSEP